MRNAFLLATVCSLFTGCQSPSITERNLRQHELIRNRAAASFENALLLKPIIRSETPAPLEQLAPLLIQEIVTNAPTPPKPNDAARLTPTVVASSRIVLIQNRWHWQYTYSWKDSNSPSQRRGIRITLDSQDAPVVWEILNPHGPDVLYVAKSIESKAQQTFGPPLPKRRFAVERSLTDHPATVVAQAIEDGPVPFGPIVYLSYPQQEVTALICRCMPAQFVNLVDQADYPLQIATNPPAGFDNTPLEQRLRLPEKF